MAEYLSPGVYVEEYDSGATPMQGVSTSTAGFVGLAERGPVVGQPQLVTSFADYKRMYGGYLSEAAYGTARFLPYAVEQFFANGGSRAYIRRAVPGDARAAALTTGVLRLTAANPGAWAEDMRVTVSAASKAKTQVLAVSGADLTLKNADGFNAGDVVELFDGKTTAHATIKGVLDRWSPWTPPAPWTWPTPRWAPPSTSRPVKSPSPPGLATRWKPSKTCP